MILKLPKIRQFTYRPLYYEPPKEEEEELRIKFRRHRIYQTHKKRPLLIMVVLVIILIFLLSYWLKFDSPDQKDFKFEDLKIEVIK